MRKWLVGALGATLIVGATVVVIANNPACSAWAMGLANGDHTGTVAIAVDEDEDEAAQLAIAKVIEGGPSSNIWPKDYVGPEVCESCHAERYAQWRGHPHSRMNQNASVIAVKADFQNAHVTLPKGEVTFQEPRQQDAGDDGPYTMTLERDKKLIRRFAVTRTIGSRFMQFFIGKQVEGPEPRENALYNTEQKLPFAYWFKIKRWLPVEYFDPYTPDTREPFDHPAVNAWASSCMFCHNTYPWAYRVGLRAPFQGFPEADLELHRASFYRTIGQTLDLTGTNAKRRTEFVIGRLKPDKDLVTIGVSCESCHFGAREHARSKAGDTPIAWMPQSNGLAIAPKASPRDPTNPYVANSICRQCHSAPQPTWANGAGVANSREALDLFAGACTSKIRCVDCHDPHRAGGAEALPASDKHVAVCTKCHSKYAGEDARSAHSHHAASAATCLDCHMPRISQGLDEVVRSHRISSPSDPRMIGTEQPNACNVCHVDKSLKWTADALAKSWNVKFQPADGPLSLGEESAGHAWLHAKSPYLRLIATQAWSHAPAEIGAAAFGDVAEILNDDTPVNRMFAMFAVERLRKAPLTLSDYDPTALPATRKVQIDALKTK